MKKILKILYKYVIKLLPAKIATVIHYSLVYKRLPKLGNPTFFSEKMQAIKLSKPRYIDILCSDKIESKAFLESIGLKQYTIPNIAVIDNLHEISLDESKYPVILKVSNGTSQHVIIHDPSELDKNIEILKKMMNFKHYIFTKEFIYGFSKRRIIIEPFLSSNSFGLDDYKIHCFNGDPLFIQLNKNSSNDRSRVMLNKDLNQINYPFASGSESIWIPKNQKEISKMIEISKIIARLFKFIRVDFYIVNNEIKIGELTLHPMAGFMLRNSTQLDTEWGRLLNITSLK
mgnify:CR=1 FL=1